VIDDVEAPNGVRVTILGGGEPAPSRMEGKRLRITLPDALAAALPVRQAYVFKIVGAK